MFIAKNVFSNRAVLDLEEKEEEENSAGNLLCF